MEYFVYSFESDGEKIAYLVPVLDVAEQRRIKELRGDRMKKVGIFEGEFRDIKDRFFLVAKTNRDQSAIMKILKEKNRNIDLSL